MSEKKSKKYKKIQEKVKGKKEPLINVELIFDKNGTAWPFFTLNFRTLKHRGFPEFQMLEFIRDLEEFTKEQIKERHKKLSKKLNELGVNVEDKCSNTQLKKE